MDLRICFTCGHVWDAQQEIPPNNVCIICATQRRKYEVQKLGQVILNLRRENLLHHGKIK